MNIPQILIVFFVSWWLVFLPALSVGVQGQHESEDGVVEGTEAGAPVAPMLWKKALWATIGSVLITIIAMIVIPLLAP